MKLKIRPYARLITMLGDQLIKNESIALIELIKNCYDADASWVKVSFVDFEEGYQNTNKSKIIIEDDGCGMNFDILVKHWMNPGTPEKLKRKENQSYVTKKGRILQGEKGIGRFAIFKLGSDITIITRRQKSDFNGNFIDKGEDSEFVLRYNFSKYDSDFLTENHEPKELFLDDLNVNLEEITPPDHICEKPFNLAGFINTIRKPYGTRIEITNLKSEWTEKKIKKIKQDTEKLQPIFTDHTTDFNIYFVNGNNNLIFNDSYYDRLTKCFEKAVFKIDNGRYDEQSKQIYFDINGKSEILNFNSPEIKGIKKFQELFNNKQKTECGSFRFMFYIFDLNADPEFSTKNVLDKEEKTIVKNHRIYLYRDGIRVMPYGRS